MLLGQGIHKGMPCPIPLPALIPATALLPHNLFSDHPQSISQMAQDIYVSVWLHPYFFHSLESHISSDLNNENDTNKYVPFIPIAALTIPIFFHQ